MNFTQEILQKLKILYVEDDLLARDEIAEFLDFEIGKVELASNGKEGLEKFKTFKPHIVITDINMPNMDGITLIENLRNRLNYISIPILVLTTERTVEMKAKGRQAGATAWMVKPFDQELLHLAILKTIAKVEEDQEINIAITRFAPSPTGYLHIGGLRTALFNYLWARKNNGKFRLRIEDTDLARNKQEATEAILEAFKWVGMDWDDEVVYQSEKFDVYKKYVNELLEKGLAYKCYLTPEELKEYRDAVQSGKEPPFDIRKYRDFKGELDKDYVIRFKAPLSGMVTLNDGVKGEVSIEIKPSDDFVIARSSGVPTYNFVVVIDDHEMGMTEIIRGDDHLNNTFKQILIYKAFGWEVPKFYHVPMIHNEKGKKLSKRDGAVDVMEYKKEGFLPEALLNFLVRLGWSYGDQEIFSMEEMIQLFNPNDINKSASSYNLDKLLWLNQHYIKNTPNKKIAKLLNEDFYMGSELVL